MNNTAAHPTAAAVEAPSAGSPASAETASLLIEGELTIYRAAELCATLLTLVQRGVDVEVDLSQVSEMDSAGVQLLMAAKQAAQAGRREFRLVSHSPAVLDVFETLNLAAHFGDPLLLSSRPA